MEKLLVNNIKNINNSNNNNNNNNNSNTNNDSNVKKKVSESLVDLEKKNNTEKKYLSKKIIDENNDKEFENFIKELNNSDNNTNNNINNNINGNNSIRDNNQQSNNLENMIFERQNSVQKPEENKNEIIDERERMMESLRNDMNSNKQESDIDIDLNEFDELIK